MEKDQRNEDKLSGEIEQIEIEYRDVQNQAQQVIDILSNPRTYDKILKTLSTEQTELHCTPHQPQERVSDRKVPPEPPVIKFRSYYLPKSFFNRLSSERTRYVCGSSSRE